MIYLRKKVSLFNKRGFTPTPVHIHSVDISFHCVIIINRIKKQTNITTKGNKIMNALTTLNFDINNGVKTMSSLELAKLCVGDKKDSHTNFVKKMKKVLGEEGVVKFYDTYLSSQNKELVCYNLPEREACLMAMSYSYELQAFVYDSWKKAEKELQEIRDYYIGRQQRVKGMTWAEACAYAGITNANQCRDMLMAHSKFNYFTKTSYGKYYVTDKGASTGYFYNRHNKFSTSTVMKISQEGREWLLENREWFNTTTKKFIESKQQPF